MRISGAAILVAVCTAGLIGVVLKLATVRPMALGSYTTSLEGRTPEQMTNIRRAAAMLDGKLVMPGDEFSMVKVIGDTGGRGYSEAPMMRAGKLEMAEAGGICQLSSTLYNAVLLAGLPVTERHAHSRPVASVPPGRDATVAAGVADLRFRNDRLSPVRIRVSATGVRLGVKLTSGGTKPPARTITVSQRRSGDRLIASVWQTASDGSKTMISQDSYRLPASEGQHSARF